VIVAERAQQARGDAGETAALVDQRQGGDEPAALVRDEQAEVAQAPAIVRVGERGGGERGPVGQEEGPPGLTGGGHGGGEAVELRAEGHEGAAIAQLLDGHR
jgi:hypothetical protein